MEVRKTVRRILWALHEFISPLGHLVWIEHRIQELEEMKKELSRGCVTRDGKVPDA